MGLLIDSSALVDFAANRTRLPANLPSGEEFYLSIITADELLRSVAWSAGKDRSRRLAFVEAVLDRFPILPIDRATVRMHAEIASGLERKKQKLGLHQSWIAATCLAHGLQLLSASAEDFAGIHGLQLWEPENPEA